jgi:hypothetical protein
MATFTTVKGVLTPETSIQDFMSLNSGYPKSRRQAIVFGSNVRDALTDYYIANDPPTKDDPILRQRMCDAAVRYEKTKSKLIEDLILYMDPFFSKSPDLGWMPMGVMFGMSIYSETMSSTHPDSPFRLEPNEYLVIITHQEPVK